MSAGPGLGMSFACDAIARTPICLVPKLITATLASRPGSGNRRCRWIAPVTKVGAMNSPRAGQPAEPATWSISTALIAAYYDRHPDPGDPAQQVSFGTSGHRGSSLEHQLQRRPHPGHQPGDLRVPRRPPHRRSALPRRRHPRAQRAGDQLGARGVRRQRGGGDDRRPRRLHPDPVDQPRDPGLQPRPHQRTRRRRRRHAVAQPARATAASSTTRPTAARPAPRSPAGSRTAPTNCCAAKLDGVQRRRPRARHPQPRTAPTSSTPTSARWPGSSTSTRSAPPASASAPTRSAAPASATGARSASGTHST